jgi:coenzyme A diphosphatase NUDT7
MSEPKVDTILRRLVEHRPAKAQYAWDDKSHPRAAVLVALQPRKDGLHVILTVRAQNLSMHPGEVALPGGKAELDEGPIDTALREAAEEVGLQIGRKDVLAVLAPIASRMGIVVYPVVALIDPDFTPTINGDEVSDHFTVPLEVFLSKRYHKSRMMDWRGGPFLVHEFHYEGHRIWALTANILTHVAFLAYSRMPEFDFSYEMYSKLKHSSVSKY